MNLWFRHTKDTKKVGLAFFTRIDNKIDNFKVDLMLMRCVFIFSTSSMVLFSVGYFKPREIISSNNFYTSLTLFCLAVGLDK